MKRPSRPNLKWKQAGAWLKSRREEAGLSQRDVAEELGFRYYTFISLVENGFSRVPTHKLEPWAKILDIDPSRFAKHLISFYEPELHRVLYNGENCG